MSTKEEVFDYVMNTPGNTNPAVLKSMLNGLPEGTSLPEVDESDNGKFLGVAEGAWTKVDAPSGGLVSGPSSFQYTATGSTEAAVLAAYPTR